MSISHAKSIALYLQGSSPIITCISGVDTVLYMGKQAYSATFSHLSIISRMVEFLSSPSHTVAPYKASPENMPFHHFVIVTIEGYNVFLSTLLNCAVKFVKRVFKLIKWDKKLTFLLCHMHDPFPQSMDFHLHSLSLFPNILDMAPCPYKIYNKLCFYTSVHFYFLVSHILPIQSCTPLDSCNRHTFIPFSLVTTPNAFTTLSARSQFS